MRTPNPLLSLDDVASWLGVPVATLYGQRYRGDPPGCLGFRVASRVRFDLRDIERWIEEQKQGAVVRQHNRPGEMPVIPLSEEKGSSS